MILYLLLVTLTITNSKHYLIQAEDLNEEDSGIAHDDLDSGIAHDYADDHSEGGDCKCGLMNDQESNRIIGGVDANIYHNIPWQAGIVYTGTNFVTCGGTLISTKWILTAAHCALDQSSTTIEVMLGDHDINDDSDTKEIRAKVSKIITHPDYEKDYMNDNDFALIMLEDPVDFSANSHIRPICLPENMDEQYVDAMAIVSGWGEMSEHQSDANHKLQEVTVKVISNDDCKRKYDVYNYLVDLTRNMICTDELEDAPGKAACGDSGGPLASTNGGDGVTPGQNYELIGVTSFGGPPDLPSLPEGYARITAQLDWIKSETIADWKTCPRT